MLFWFPAFISSTWWNFNIAGFQLKLRNIRNKPIFLLLYNKYCPYCQGLPEGIKAYSQGLGNRDDIYISMIDCYSELSCSFFKISGTPTLYLINGPDEQYWPKSPERGPEGWDRWINQTLNYSFTEITSKSQLEETLDNYTDGGSVFHLEVPSENHIYYKKVRELTKYYKNFQDVFLFQINSSIKDPKLTAYTSKYCQNTFSGFSFRLESFINKYKFGVLHPYSPYELIHSIQQNPGAILFNHGQIVDSQREALKTISKGNCKLNYGYVDASEDTDSLKYVKAAPSEMPFLAGIGRLSGAKLIYKGKVADAWNSGFLNKTVKYASGNILKSLIAQAEFIHLIIGLLIILIVLLSILIYMIIEICRLNRMSKDMQKIETV
ncbi:hypothetical protein TVAG_249120 [Trichomonas vaginalis G3]|uniref:Thioredoxin domain-containing protein n=1 Tax=Trichomonas vaginalis (strain ATCC PRA-98 / G3) TaxID=412133 RepID=A2DCB5_TRIV3|nr:thioredoxin-like family [Trichomonas vaginalis G3]EAY21852.1 hypothetical protein TVAG_249120 [Trichomonas vaginalis G3]KAI5487678.1 thioredoxin-like family [Trichomonas vaginalis G3]|eukprot:XP_001582838.1 hypothetical protein [Trichomonas vaginalis G3]